MDDFASGAVVRILLRGMTARGLAAPCALPDGARVSIEQKRLVIAHISRSGGLSLVFTLAQQIERIVGEPLYSAFASARDPHDLLVRWQRLERYVHSRHCVRVVACSAAELVLEHAARSDTPPLPEESAAVLGVWVGALRLLGTQDLHVEVGGQAIFGANAPGKWHDTAAQHWRIRWTASTAQSSATWGRSTMEGLAPWPWPEPAAALATWLAGLLAESPCVADAAKALRMSRRTLQRKLAAAGVGFGELRAEVRVRVAAVWLAQATLPLPEIGFLCGYADQAHFTREFTRLAGLPPARFRATALGY